MDEKAKARFVIENRDMLFAQFASNHSAEEVEGIRDKIGEWVAETFDGVPMGTVALALELVTNAVLCSMLEFEEPEHGRKS